MGRKQKTGIVLNGDILSTIEESPVSIANIKYEPLVSVDVGLTIFAYKRIFSKERNRITIQHLKMHLVVYWKIKLELFFFVIYIISIYSFVDSFLILASS